MSNEINLDKIENDIEFAKNKIKDFEGFFEINDFKTFLLLNLYDDTPDLMKKFLGGKNDFRLLLYEIKKKCYIIEIFSTADYFIDLYIKTDPVTDRKVLSEDDLSFFNKYFTPFEIENLMKTKFKVLTSRIVNLESEVNKKYSLFPKIEIVRVYYDLESFFYANDHSKYYFQIDGNENEPNIIFNFILQLPNGGEKYIPIEIFIDHEKRFNKRYIKLNNNNFKFETLDDIKDASLSDLNENKYLLIVHIKSLNPP
ncbi:MAG: hypothetical protein ACTSRZ_00980 [Promethearchaeota archaeon]